LQLVRRRGFAVSEGEKLPGAQGIAAPVFGPDGIVGCLCITAPKGRIPRDSVLTIGRAVALEAAELSRALGAPLSSGA
jgi:DNA-binding IclR family transcriptional regulator